MSGTFANDWKRASAYFAQFDTEPPEVAPTADPKVLLDTKIKTERLQDDDIRLTTSAISDGKWVNVTEQRTIAGEIAYILEVRGTYFSPHEAIHMAHLLERAAQIAMEKQAVIQQAVIAKLTAKGGATEPKGNVEPFRKSRGYPDNTKQWQVGDLVIHKADAKRSDMLMRVTGFEPDGIVKSKYVDLSKPKQTWQNDLSELLDPADFSIELPKGGA